MLADPVNIHFHNDGCWIMVVPIGNWHLSIHSEKVLFCCWNVDSVFRWSVV